MAHLSHLSGRGAKVRDLRAPDRSLLPGGTITEDLGEDPRPMVVFGGVYNNYLSLIETLSWARSIHPCRIVCLGDLGGFGPHPDRVFPLIASPDIALVQGNYDDSIGNGKEDCGCGYTDPRDNHWARLSYAYTLANTHPDFRDFQRNLPPARVWKWGPLTVMGVHGSPRRVSEFLWESTSGTDFLEHLLTALGVDVLLCTHTGIPWMRSLSEGRWMVNVGAIGRPANDGRTAVWACLLRRTGAHVQPALVPIAYDHLRLAKEMDGEGLPEEFSQTLLTGWWTTCLEILPVKERRRGPG